MEPEGCSLATMPSPKHPRSHERRDLDHERRTFIEQVVGRVLSAAARHERSRTPAWRRYESVLVEAPMRRTIVEEASAFFTENRRAIDDARDLARLPTAGGFRPTAAADAYFERRYSLSPDAFGTDGAAAALRAAADRQDTLAFVTKPHARRPGEGTVVPAVDDGGEWTFEVAEGPDGAFVVQGERSGATYWRGDSLEAAFRARARLAGR